MKRRIYLLRHGKSSWNDPAREDRERELNPRGSKAAERMGQWCAANGVKPDLALCSTAARARETLARLLLSLKIGRIEFEDGLYMAGAAALLARLRKLDDGVKAVMVVGHNPGMQEFACLLAGGGEPKDLARLNARLPTAALAELSADLKGWRELNADKARLERFILPRELP